MLPSSVKYGLIREYGGVFFCDPDYYPVARAGREEEQAAGQFAAIRDNAEEFLAILGNNGIRDTSPFPPDIQLLVYREHKKLSAIKVEKAPDGYSFALRVGEKQGFAIEGKVNFQGKIQVLKKEPVFNTCPICLSAGTRVDTPGGPIAVKDLRVGVTVWTADLSGNRIPGVVLEVATRNVPAHSQLLHIKLAGGRELTASPGHPSAEGKRLADYRPGDMLDGSPVESVEEVGEPNTYDILPSGPTGFYWANGVLLGSALAEVARGR